MLNVHLGQVKVGVDRKREDWATAATTSQPPERKGIAQRGPESSEEEETSAILRSPICIKACMFVCIFVIDVCVCVFVIDVCVCICN